MDLQIALHRGHENVTRLRFLSGMAWSNTDALFHRVGLQPGMRCLDVRCGTGQVTLPMARLAGPSGLVVGVDPEEQLLKQAREAAARQGVKAEFRQGDAAELDETTAYDLVYTRFLLSQRPRHEAEQALRSMMRVVQPGGTIVVEDLDCAPEATSFASENPAYARFLELFNALISNEGTDPAQALQLPELLEHAGVSAVRCESPAPDLAGSDSRNPACLLLDSIRHAIVAAQIATRTEVDRLATELDRLRFTPSGLFWLPRIVQVWGSVPTISAGM
jgi:ubiquinone/menaquinone biosynthesis C-methylase UbiE